MTQNQKESSVLFSLKELMTLEQDRVKQEEELERQAEAAMVARQNEERARHLREEEERARRAEEERRVAAQRTREEQARIEAIHQAEIERARLDAENAARLAQLQRQQEHEADLARLTQDRGKKRLRYIVAGTISLLLVALSAGGFIIHQQVERQRALEGQLAGLESDRDALHDKFIHATSPEDRAALQAQLDQKDQQIRDLQSKSSPGATATATATTPRVIPTVRATTTASATPCVKDFDPLNPCLR